MKNIKLCIYLLLIFLVMTVYSTKSGPSKIFEFKSDDEPKKHISDVIGLYQATSKISNNFTVYKKLGTEMYIFVHNWKNWVVNTKFAPNSTYVSLYSTDFASGDVPQEPPPIHWKQPNKDDVIIIKWELFDCCDEIELTASKNGMGYYRPERIGKYRETELTNAGRFVYQQVDGNNVLYYVEKEGWRISESVGGPVAIKYDSSSSCPVGKPQSSNTYWRYAYGTVGNSGFSSDATAMAKCLIQNVSDMICLIENSTIANKVEACTFPFRFRGKVYDSCITDNNDPSKSWCSTGKEIENGAYKYDDSKWGYCQQNCTTKKTVPQDDMRLTKLEDLPLPLSGIIVLSALTPLVVLLVIALSVYAIQNLRCNCKCYKDREIVEQNPVYGLGDDDDAIEATDANSIYGDEDDEYENIENA